MVVLIIILVFTLFGFLVWANTSNGDYFRTRIDRVDSKVEPEVVWIIQSTRKSNFFQKLFGYRTEDDDETYLTEESVKGRLAQLKSVEKRTPIID